MAQARRGTSTHALSRAVRRMARDGVVDLDKRRQNLDYDELSEVELQFQVPIDGVATGAAIWTPVDVAFDVSFYDAPEMRDSPLTMPHFHYGAVLSGETDDASNHYGAVVVNALVVDWKRDEKRDAFTGATVVVGVYSPTASEDTVDFSGWVHLTFQGYGALDENDLTILDASDS